MQKGVKPGQSQIEGRRREKIKQKQRENKLNTPRFKTK